MSADRGDPRAGLTHQLNSEVEQKGLHKDILHKNQNNENAVWPDSNVEVCLLCMRSFKNRK